MEFRDPLLPDFARRTLANLQLIEDHDRREGQIGVPEEERSAFPVSALVNSLLGLIVFPKEEYAARLPNPTLDELIADGWPQPEISYPVPICSADNRRRARRPAPCTGEGCACPNHLLPQRDERHSQCRTLHQLIRTLRNGIAHFGIEFISEPSSDRQVRSIVGLRVWNTCDKCLSRTVQVQLTVAELRVLARKYAELVAQHE